MKLALRAGAPLAFAVAACLAPAAAYAEDGGPSFSGSVTFLTDYRLRGASLSDTEPVIQGNIEGTLPLGENVSLFAGIWASSLDKDAGAGAMETDFYGGIQGELGGVKLRARYLRLVFHDVDDLDFDQFEVGATVPVGQFAFSTGGVRDEYNGGGHSTYAYAKTTYNVKNTGLQLAALIGYENGSNWDDKVNWMLGASYTYKGVTFGANYQDTNRFSPTSDGKNRAGSTVVFSIGAGF